MKRPYLVLILILSLSIFTCAQTYALSDTIWKGKVVGVSDGDTITVLHHGKGEKIRLYGIDCPEKKQAFGKRAKQVTSKMVFDKNVEVRPVTTDRYGRTIAWIYINGTCLNEELLKTGLAWHYKQYSSERRLADLEIEAKQRKAGLWSDPHSIAPWDFRRGKSEAAAENQTRTDHKNIAYHGNIKSKKFHRPSCRYYECTNCTTTFHSREEAIQAGYEPCKICSP